LIRDEEKLFQAYGSNLLGAAVGGASEYLSMLLGFKFLLCVALALYVAAFVTIALQPRGASLTVAA
jgi:hypothetical protein